MKLRAKVLEHYPGALSEFGLLPEHYVVTVSSPHSSCETCGTALRVQHPYRRSPAGLMVGRPVLIHRVKQCPHCGRSYRCEELSELLPPSGQYAYDVIVEVGLARCRDHKQEGEILSSVLAPRQFDLPRGSIDMLTKKFLDSFLAVHLAGTEALCELLERNGGYVMHLDGTCEAGSKVLFVAMDGVSGTVLTAGAMQSENQAGIRSLVDDCIERFGLPLAVVSDLSKNIAAAVEHLPGSVKRLLCHYHFLENVGKKLIQRPHTELNKRLNAVKLRPQFKSLRHDLVRYITEQSRQPPRRVVELIEQTDEVVREDPVHARRSLAYLLLGWLDDHSSDLRGETFPFDQPALAIYRRAKSLSDWLTKNLDDCGLKRSERKTLQSIAEKLHTAFSDTELTKAAERLEKAVEAFEEVRRALRFERHDGKPVRRAQPPASTISDAERTEDRLNKLRRSLLSRTQAKDHDRVEDAKTVIAYLDKYYSKLHGHVIRVPDTNRVVLVQRTNNPPEHLFGRTKRGWRRRLGTGKLVRRVHAARPAELLLANLDSQQYLDICYQGSTRNMAPVFARHWAQAAEIRRQRTGTRNNATTHVPKSVLRHDSFFENLTKALRKLAACMA